MLPKDGSHPTGKNNIVLATHARWIGEQHSTKKRIARESASVPVLTHQPGEEPRPNGRG